MYCLLQMCTNICNDWEQASAITIDGRGQDSKFSHSFDNKLMKSDCTFCGQCKHLPYWSFIEQKN